MAELGKIFNTDPTSFGYFGPAPISSLGTIGKLTVPVGASYIASELGISVHSAYAFFFDAAGVIDFSAYANQSALTVRIYDSTSALICSGTPGNAGSGASGGNLGANLMTSGNMDSAGQINSWPNASTTMTLAAGGYSGNCMSMVETGSQTGGDPLGYLVINVGAGNSGCLYQFNCYTKEGTPGVSGRVEFRATGLPNYDEDFDFGSSWNSKLYHFNGEDDITHIFVFRLYGTSGGGEYGYWDEFTYKKVLEPPTKGLWIDGGWSVGAGNINDPAWIEIVP